MTFYELLTAAVREFETNGYSSERKLSEWMDKILKSAKETMVDVTVIDRQISDSLRAIYKRQIEDGGALKSHAISRFTLEKVKPKIRAELDRRIMASANLIKLNRAAAIEKTLQRFSGWATSIPDGGSRSVDKLDVKDNIRKSLASLQYEERRVAIDQGHKFVSSLNNIIAVDAGAIAGKWKSNWKQAGYNYRKDHKERDQKIYLIRNNWAKEKGLVKVGPDGYMDDITMPGEEVFCSCKYIYLYNLRDLPDNMLTNAGKEVIKR